MEGRALLLMDVCILKETYVQHSTVQYSIAHTTQYRSSQYNTEQYITAHTEQYRSAQYITLQHTTA
jgi:hypothetical protein